MTATPCEGSTCGPGQRCENSGGTATASTTPAKILDCGTGERCEEHVEGGHVCEDATCDDDLACAADQHCAASGMCEDDVCESSVRTCDGASVLECSGNGGEMGERFTCGSAAYFESSASRITRRTRAAPARTTGTARVHRLRGRPAAPAPAPRRPAPCRRAVRGHAARDRDPVGRRLARRSRAHDGTAAAIPLRGPAFSHVRRHADRRQPRRRQRRRAHQRARLPRDRLHRPTAATTSRTNGVVRAIHGGGPNKGKDYFALCGTRLARGRSVDATRARAATPTPTRPRPVAVGDLDGDGMPEIVVPTESDGFRSSTTRASCIYHAAPHALDGRTGNPPSRSRTSTTRASPRSSSGATSSRSAHDAQRQARRSCDVFAGTMASGHERARVRGLRRQHRRETAGPGDRRAARTRLSHAAPPRRAELRRLRRRRDGQLLHRQARRGVGRARR